MPISILLVDDDYDIQQAIFRYLVIKRNDITVELASSAEEALGKLGHNHYDLIITDNRMYKMSGIALLKIVREHYPDIKRIMFSGDIEIDIYKEASKLSHKYISKPCNISDLLIEIDSLFQK